MGFEPTRAEHIGLAVQRLNHSATVSPESNLIFSVSESTETTGKSNKPFINLF